APFNESEFDTRLNADGSIDTSFGTNGFTGKQLTDYDFATDSNGVLALAGGKTLLVGSKLGVDTGRDFLIKRYNADGTIDTTFANGGTLLLNLQGSATPTPGVNGSDDVAYRAAVQTDGKIVVVGTSDAGTGGKFAVVRLNADGSMDTSWGN